jgi:predicted phosphodiesterase
MRLVIFSDVHGNLPALEKMLTDAGVVDGYICLGDIVNYGPWSNECIDLILSLPNTIVLEGNHEKYFIDGHYSGEPSIAQEFFNFCYPSFKWQEKIKNLKKEYILNGFIFKHTIKNRYIYSDTNVNLDNNYVVGHSHHQFIISQPPFVLYNVGSVGQNRKYINVINYLTLKSETMNFTMHSVIYNEQLIIQEMKRKKYPKSCIDYYDNKERLSSHQVIS